MVSMEYTLLIYNPTGKGKVLWDTVFPSGNRHSKRQKRCTIKDTVLIKISFNHYKNYITWIRVKLPIAFEEYDPCMFSRSFFLLTIIVNL